MKTEFTTDKPGHKIQIVDGKPTEVKMDNEEKRDRFEGQRKENGNVPNQTGRTQTNNNMAAKYRKKKEAKKEKPASPEVLKSSVSEAVTDDIKKAQKRVEILSNKLKKAKLDQKELTLVQREAEVVKKEKTYKKVEQFMNNDKKKLIDKHSYFTTDNEKDGKTKKLSDKLQKTIDSTIGKQEVKESALDKAVRICELANFGKTKKGDVLTRLNARLNEAPQDEEDPLADLGGDAGAEGEDPLAGGEGEGGGEDPLAGGGEGGDTGEEGADSAEGADGEAKDLEDIEDLEDVPEDEKTEPNEIELTVEREEFNVDTNNAYSFYDFIVDRVLTDNAKDALNVEYSNIPEVKRKVMPARIFYDAVIKRLNIDNKAEKKRLEAELETDNADQL